MTANDWIVPDWPAPLTVRAVTTTRTGGVSRGLWRSMNPAAHVGDDPAAVQANRERLQALLDLPTAPVWLQQVHGTGIVDATTAGSMAEADGSWSRSANVVCAVLTADCLPVLLSDRHGHCVAAAHAGWRGLAAGVVEAAISALRVNPADLLAWLGPAIGPQAFAVGEEVRDAFVAHDPAATAAFRPGPDGILRADLYHLARQRLAGVGVRDVYGGQDCTYTDEARFFSYRRDGVTGRMASLIWLAGEQGNAYDA
ncbi:MAG: peptidoglycan editing factor PgeF [Gammaproteobacteria bacterium]